MTTPSTETHRFEAEVARVLHLVINSLYSNKDIFLRELVSNASDALDRLKYRALTEHELTRDVPLRVRVSADAEAGTVTIDDTGVGMTREELIKSLGTVAHSGSRSFLDALERAQGQGGPQLIGQFGVGFYSAFLVADQVEVVTRPAGGEGGAWRWRSDGRESFSVEPADRPTHGTTIVLHLNAEQREYASPWKLRELIGRYSDYIGHPIELEVDRYGPPPGEAGDEDASAEPTVTKAWEQVNRATALWQRSPSEVSSEEYAELYKHLTHDWEDPLAHTHFKVEGTQMFNGILYVPKRPPAFLYSPEQHPGVRLHVKRVFIMDDCRALLPLFLRFLRGVVDSDDLPLNVSRELLQDSSVVRFIKKQLTRKAFDMLDELARERPEDYVAAWKSYGPVLKEGLHTSPEHRDRLVPLLRFRSSASEDGWTSLADYKARMPEGQKAIFYVIGDSERAVSSSPYLEALRKRGYEALYLTDPIDEWAIHGLGTYEDLPLESAMSAELDVDDTDEAKEAREALAGELAGLLERFRTVLGDRVSDVRLGGRLVDSPVCLVVPEGGHHAHVERLFRATQPGFVGQKRILEVNGEHAVIRNIHRQHQDDPESPRVAEWIEVLHAQALLAEGSPLEEPARFVGQVTRLLDHATRPA